MKNKNKRGQLNAWGTLGAFALGIVVFTFIIGFGALFLGQLQGSSSVLPVYGSNATAVTGEAITILNGTAVNVSNQLVNTGSWAIYNGSNVLGLGNFTLNNATGSVTLKADNTIPQYDNTSVSVNYTYDNSATLLTGNTNASAAIGNGQVGLTSLSSWISILVIAGVFVVILGMIALIGLGGYAMYKQK